MTSGDGGMATALTLCASHPSTGSLGVEAEAAVRQLADWADGQPFQAVLVLMFAAAALRRSARPSRTYVTGTGYRPWSGRDIMTGPIPD